MPGIRLVEQCHFDLLDRCNAKESFRGVYPSILGDPITDGGIANIYGLSAFDSAYRAVRGKPFAAR